MSFNPIDQTTSCLDQAPYLSLSLLSDDAILAVLERMPLLSREPYIRGCRVFHECFGPGYAFATKETTYFKSESPVPGYETINLGHGSTLHFFPCDLGEKWGTPIPLHQLLYPTEFAECVSDITLAEQEYIRAAMFKLWLLEGIRTARLAIGPLAYPCPLTPHVRDLPKIPEQPGTAEQLRYTISKIRRLRLPNAAAAS